MPLNPAKCVTLINVMEIIVAIISRQAIVPFTPAQMFALVNDIGAYPEFLPWCQSSAVHHRDEDQVKATVVVASAGLHKSFTTHNLLQKDKMIEIRLVDGPFKHLEGFWRFDHNGDNSCQISFDLEFEFAGWLLDMAFGPIFHQVTNSLVDSFQERAEQIYQQNP
jgi:ribosome-associated toxin RatA of RatAB toxin-antitoxin module